MKDNKLYVDILSRQADKDGRPYEMALSDFCDFLPRFIQRRGIQGQRC